MTRQFKGPDGKIIPISDSMSQEDMAALYTQLEEDAKPENQGFGASAWNAVKREGLRLPGRIAVEAPNFVRDVLEYSIEGKDWKDTTKAEDDPLTRWGGTKATDEALGDTSFTSPGLYDTKARATLSGRMGDRVGTAAANALIPGGLTKSGLMAAGGALAGQTLGGEVIDPVLPDEYKGYAEPILGVAGGLYGGYRGITPPKPNANPSIRGLFRDVENAKPLPQPKIMPEAPMVAQDLPLTPPPPVGSPHMQGEMFGTEPSNFAQRELPLGAGRGAPPGPPTTSLPKFSPWENRTPMPPPSEAAVTAGQIAEQKLTQLKTVANAKKTGNIGLLDKLVPEDPGTLTRLGSRLGVTSAKTDQQIAIADSVARIAKLTDKIEGGLAGQIKDALYDVLAHTSIGMRPTPHSFVRAGSLLKTVWNLIGGSRAPKQLQAEFKNLSDIIRTGEPIATRGSVVRDAVKGGVGGLLSGGRSAAQGAGGLLDKFAEKYGVDAGPSGPGATFGAGPLLMKPSSLQKARLFHAGAKNVDELLVNEQTIGTGAKGAIRGPGLYTAEEPKVMERYWKSDNRSGTHGSTAWGMVDPEGKFQDFYSKDVRSNTPEFVRQDAAFMVQHAGGIDEALTQARKTVDIETRYTTDTALLSRALARVKQLEQWKDEGWSEYKPTPYTKYELDFEHDPKGLLHWDKTFGEQSDQVKRGLLSTSKFSGGQDDAASASSVYWHSKGVLNQQGLKDWEIPKAMADEGIEANKYLDQFSRPDGVAAKTYNYVIHDPKKLTILRKFGVPMVAGLGGAFVVLEKNMPDELKDQMREES